MPRYCTYCKNTVEPAAEGWCPDCGAQLDNTPQAAGYYLSEPKQGSGLTVHLEPGKKLLDGRYTIGTSLERGNVKFYLAEDNRRSEKVELEVVPLVWEDLANRLKGELESWSQVGDYSSAIRLHDVHVSAYEGVVLLLVSTEYADGGPLSRWLLKNKDNICTRHTEGLRYFKQACRGIEAIHAANLVHANLTPESLGFVGGVLKVLHPGLSRCLASFGMDAYGCRPAAPEFPPERGECKNPERVMAARSGITDPRLDIYALGMILFQVFDPQARPPFDADYRQLRQRHLDIPAPELKGASANVTRVVARSLRKDPADRYRTVTELIDDLECGGRPETAADLQVSGLHTDQPVLELWNQACESMGTGKLNESGSLCDRILNIEPEHGQAKQMRAEIDSRFEQAKQLYEAIKDGLGNQSFVQLCTLVTEGVDIFPNHPDGAVAQTRLISAIGEYESAMDDGFSAMGQGHFSQAQTLFGRALELDCGSSNVAVIVNVVSEIRENVGLTRGEIDTAIQRQDWNRAMSLASWLDRYIDRIKEAASHCVAWERNNEDRNSGSISNRFN